MKKTNKCLRMLIMLLTLSAAFSLGVSAGESGELAREKTDELLEDFSLILPDGMESLADGDGVSEALGFPALVADAVEALRGGVPDALSFFLFLMGIAVILAVAGQVTEGMSGAVRSAVSVLTGGAILLRLIPLLSEASACFTDVGEFFSLLIPILTGGAALSGGGALAAAAGTGMSLTLSLFGALCKGLLPLVAVVMVLGVICTLAPDAVGGVLDASRRSLMRGLGILSAALGGLFALQTAVAAAQDGAALRAVKYAASGSIPVVGGTVSGAISTLAGGIGYAVGIIGGGGVTVILSLVLSALVRLLLYKLAFFLVTLFLECLPTGDAGCIKAMSQGLDVLIAVYSLGAVIYVLETVVLMKGIISVL